MNITLTITGKVVSICKKNFSNNISNMPAFLSLFLLSFSINAKSIVGNWKCSNNSGLETILTLNSDGTMTGSILLGNFPGRYKFDGKNFVYVLTLAGIESKPVVNVIYKIEKNYFNSFPKSNPAQKEICKRIDPAIDDQLTREYDAECKNGDCTNGSGLIFYSGGDKYEGDFSEGERSGKGIYTWKDGSRYIGDFKLGKQHGQGVTYDHEGTILFKGEYIYGETTNESDTSRINSQASAKVYKIIISGMNCKIKIVQSESTMIDYDTENLSGMNTESTYSLGPHDQIKIEVLGLSNTVRIAPSLKKQVSYVDRGQQNRLEYK